MIKIAKTDIKKAFLGLFGSICTLDDLHAARMWVDLRPACTLMCRFFNQHCLTDYDYYKRPACG